ncbi:MAG: vitamin K epoxide reductase family protein [bacterium]|nr:vitamin K epoxide reductase family protein [bacterium]
MSTQQTVQNPPVSHNPASKWLNLRNISLLLVVFGLFVSGYLSYVKLTNAPMVCPTGEGSAFNCEVVQNSIYAYMPPKSGIAIAWLGFATYLVIGWLLLLERHLAFLYKWNVPIQKGVVTETTRFLSQYLGEWLVPITFGIVTFAFLFSMYLVYVQAVLLKAFCMWCLMHEANMTILFIVSVIRLISFLNKPNVEEA